MGDIVVEEGAAFSWLPRDGEDLYLNKKAVLNQLVMWRREVAFWITSKYAKLNMERNFGI